MARAVRNITKPTKTSAISSPNSSFTACQVVCSVLVCLCSVSATFLWYSDFLKEEDPTWSSWLTSSVQKVLRRDADEPTLSSRISSWFYATKAKSFQTIEAFTQNFTLEHLTSWDFIKAHYLSVLIVTIICLFIIIYTCCACLRRTQKYEEVDYGHKGLEEVGLGDAAVHQSVVHRHYQAGCSRLTALLFTLLLVALLISIPWEFIRLYQHAVSKKAAVTIGGMPAECYPHKMSLWQTMKSWLRWHFSWTQDPCEEYHKAVLVDPLWEVTPMMVISSALTRCIIHPVEAIAAGIGDALRAFLSSIPSPWQPIVLAIFVCVLIILIVMSCGYRVSIPFVLHLEPTKQTQHRLPPVHRGRTPKAIENFHGDSS